MAVGKGSTGVSIPKEKSLASQSSAPYLYSEWKINPFSRPLLTVWQSTSWGINALTLHCRRDETQACQAETGTQEWLPSWSVRQGGSCEAWPQQYLRINSTWTCDNGADKTLCSIVDHWSHCGPFGLRFTSEVMTCAMHHLKKGMNTGCTISVSLFSLAINMFFKSAEIECRGPPPGSNMHQPPIRPFMDDLTVTTQSVQGCWWRSGWIKFLLIQSQLTTTDLMMLNMSRSRTTCKTIEHKTPGKMSS